MKKRWGWELAPRSAGCLLKPAGWPRKCNAWNCCSRTPALQPPCPCLPRQSLNCRRQHLPPIPVVDSDTELDWTLPDEVLQQPSAQSAPRPAKPATQWTPPAPAPRHTPAQPDWATRLVQTGLRFFTEGNPAVKIGLLLLFFGVAFLLRYASEHISVSLVWRLNGIAAAGAGLLGLGLWFVPRKRLYGLLLQGGGIGILYMTAFAALRLFHLLDATPTFVDPGCPGRTLCLSRAASGCPRAGQLRFRRRLPRPGAGLHRRRQSYPAVQLLRPAQRRPGADRLAEKLARTEPARLHLYLCRRRDLGRDQLSAGTVPQRRAVPAVVLRART